MPRTVSPSHRFFIFACTWVAGLTLVAAGVLKLLYPPLLADLPPEVTGALSVGEAMLGLWLVSGINRVQAVLFGILAFAGLAVVSGWTALHGGRDCGCLGALPTHPWLTCGLDVLLALGLSLTLWRGTDRAMLRQQIRQFLATVVVLAAVIVAIVLAVLGRYGSIAAALRSWEGLALEAPPAVFAIPFGDDGTTRAAIPIQNLSEAPVRLIGSDVCCGSKIETAFPKVLNPGEAGTVVVTMNCGRRRSLVVTLWIESGGRLRKQRVVVSCRRLDD